MTTATVWKDGLGFGEGPRWHDGRLWFSDFYRMAAREVPEILADEAAGATRLARGAPSSEPSVVDGNALGRVEVARV